MAALGHTVDSGSGASGDYASLNALEAAQEQDLTDGGGDTYTATCTTTGDNAADTTAVDITGWTTGAATYILIESADDHAGKWDATKYRLEVANATVLTVREDYVRFSGLQIGKSSSNGNDQYLMRFVDAGTSDTRVGYCILKQAGNNSYTETAIHATDATLKVYNTVIYNVSTIASTSYCLRNAGGTTYLWNCTLSGGHRPTARISGTVEVRMTIGTGANNDPSGTYSNSDYNATDTTNAWGGGNDITGATFTFINAGSGDFHLHADDVSGAKDGGITDPSSGLYDDDIDQVTRVGTWDIGADEYVAPGGGGIVVLRRRRM